MLRDNKWTNREIKTPVVKRDTGVERKRRFFSTTKTWGVKINNRSVLTTGGSRNVCLDFWSSIKLKKVTVQVYEYNICKNVSLLFLFLLCVKGKRYVCVMKEGTWQVIKSEDFKRNYIYVYTLIGERNRTFYKYLFNQQCNSLKTILRKIIDNQNSWCLLL